MSEREERQKDPMLEKEPSTSFAAASNPADGATDAIAAAAACCAASWMCANKEPFDDEKET